VGPANPDGGCQLLKVGVPRFREYPLELAAALLGPAVTEAVDAYVVDR
jgi:hypothetical protein